MAILKIAYVTTYIHDVEPLLSAVKSVRNKYGEIVDVQVRTGEDLASESILKEFMAFAEKSHIAIFHLMGEPPNFEKTLSKLKEAKIPVFAGTIGDGRSAELRRISTVSMEDYEKILQYSNYGGTKKNT